MRSGCGGRDGLLRAAQEPLRCNASNEKVFAAASAVDDKRVWKLFERYSDVAWQTKILPRTMVALKRAGFWQKSKSLSVDDTPEALALSAVIMLYRVLLPLLKLPRGSYEGLRSAKTQLKSEIEHLINSRHDVTKKYEA
eukprot:SM000100S09390  [mRNA]  locus=s100:83181:85081:+ [translate_table: standard]